MIEIIREEEMNHTTERRSLPKDIKQMGRPDIGDRIYVENEVYQLLHPYGSVEEKRAYVLLGHFDNYAGKECVFVEAAIYLKEMMFDGDLPVWNDGTWAYIYKQLRKEFDRMVIVGWAMDIKGQLPNMTMWIEQLHQNHFGGEHQVLFLMDSLEGEEAFYGNRNGHMFRREGFYIYYVRNASVILPENEVYIEDMEPMVNVVQNLQQESIERDVRQEELSRGVREEVFEHRGSYRKQMAERTEPRLFPSYASTLGLLMLLIAMGLAVHSNNEKMVAMEETLARMEQSKETVTSTETAVVAVEQVEGNVPKQDANTVSNMEVSENAGAADGTSVAENAEVVQNAESTQNTESTDNTEVAQSIEEEQSTEVAQNIEVAQNTETQQVLTAQAENTSQTMATNTMTEAQTYLAQGYYVVQPGDSLVGICKKIYQTTAMMDKLCEVNGIEDENAIYAGQKITLPN